MAAMAGEQELEVLRDSHLPAARRGQQLARAATVHSPKLDSEFRQSAVVRPRQPGNRLRYARDWKWILYSGRPHRILIIAVGTRSYWINGHFAPRRPSAWFRGLGSTA